MQPNGILSHCSHFNYSTATILTFCFHFYFFCAFIDDFYFICRCRLNVKKQTLDGKWLCVIYCILNISMINEFISNWFDTNRCICGASEFSRNWRGQSNDHDYGRQKTIHWLWSSNAGELHYFRCAYFHRLDNRRIDSINSFFIWSQEQNIVTNCSSCVMFVYVPIYLITCRRDKETHTCTLHTPSFRSDCDWNSPQNVFGYVANGHVTFLFLFLMIPCVED